MRAINVIDMYHGNVVKTEDFKLLRGSGIFAIIHKAGQGLHYKDPAYTDRIKRVADAGMLPGAYHFLDASDPVEQAQKFIENAGITDQSMPDNISLWADYEDYGNNSASLHALQQFMAECDRVKPGLQVGVYSGNRIRETLTPHVAGFQNAAMSGTQYFFQMHRLWLAEYGPVEKIPYPWNTPIVKSSDQSAPSDAPGVFLWQFTETGRVNPLIGKTDGNFFDGTFEQLQARWLA